jgi:hypothetical protein
MNIDLRTSTGRLKGTVTAHADWYVGFDTSFRYYAVINAGDTVTLVPAEGPRIGFPVLIPSATADPETNTIFGTAEPGLRVEAFVERPAGTYHSLETQVSQHGTFFLDFSPLVDWEYGDHLQVRQWVTEYARISIRHDTPELTVLPPGP